jgi:hypothetical protein
VLPLSFLTVGQLKAGGIRPIEEIAWGEPPFEGYDHWLLTGIPAESYAQVGNTHQLKLTIIPLEPTQPPPAASLVGAAGVEDAIAAAFPAQFGRIIVQPGLDTAHVADVEGMSGSPVYGVKIVDGQPKYWLLGIESSWFIDSRIVKFYPSICFFEAFKLAIQQLRERGAAGAQ